MAVPFATDVSDPRPRSRGQTFWQQGQILFSQASQTFYFTTPAGSTVLRALTVVTEAMDGSPTLDLGDSAEDDGYIATAVVAPGTALTTTTPAVHVSMSATSPEAFQFGKYYPTDDKFLAAWVKGSGSTTGKVLIAVEMLAWTPAGVPAGLLSSAVL